MYRNRTDDDVRRPTILGEANDDCTCVGGFGDLLLTSEVTCQNSKDRREHTPGRKGHTMMTMLLGGFKVIMERWV